MKKTILVTGGAGYIGSHTAYLLSQNDFNVIVLDKLLYKQKFNHKWAKLIVGDCGNLNTLDSIFQNHKIDAVMHFAAFIEIGKSVTNPKEFYENNVIKTANLLNKMLEYNIKKFIFSSSCAVYGNPISTPMNESHPKNPLSPYGKCKLAVEYILEDYSNAYDLQYIALRYFNACGATPEIGLGENHIPETHIIPLLLRAIKNNKPFHVFGDDYDTKDGSCIRDYIHVRDLAEAHVLSLKHLDQTNNSDFFNLGTGNGYSVLEIIKTAEKICGQKSKIQLSTRRDGDVNTLVANSNKAYRVLNWKPEYSNLEKIIKDALEWEKYIYSDIYKNGKLHLKTT